jgi:hypothetical protein
VSVRFEMFATGRASTDALWALVGDPWRLAEWTDVESVAHVRGEPVRVGTAIETVEAGTTRVWEVVTLEGRLIEMRTTTERGGVAVGFRVVRDARGGSRLVLAAGLDPTGTFARLRARLFDVPALQRRMDRWAANALRIAASDDVQGTPA